MTKSSSIRAVVASVVAVSAVFVATAWIAYAEGWIEFKTRPQSGDERLKTGKVVEAEDNITFLCDANYSVPTNGIEGPYKEYKEMLAAGLDYKNQAGWYQGTFSISESRKGALVMRGNKATVTRPAMFERFGTMVTSEQFTLDRATGEFHQSLTLKDGRKIEIVKGYCGKLTKAPF